MKKELMWIAHNMIAHPISEVCHWIGRFGDLLHDITVPEHEDGEGRG